MDAAYANDQFLNKLAPNPVFTFEKAIEARFDQVSALPFWRQNKYKDDIQTAFSKSGKYFIGLDDSNYDHQSDTLTEHFFRKTKANTNDNLTIKLTKFCLFNPETHSIKNSSFL